MPNFTEAYQKPMDNPSMEDSTAMTIEFLRARLLSERSVSRTARQRADELAKKVTELEEKLKIVSLQRKKAEKATADVLAILGNHGRSDVSEAFDSSSDQEAIICDSKIGTTSVNGEETSGNVKVGGSDVEMFSGSELECSSLNGRSLSWKSSKDSSHSLEKKYMDSSRRRRSSFASTGSSPKRVGKSCRQIRRREHRSAVEELQNDATRSDNVPNFSEIGPENSREGSENHEEKDLLEVSVSVLENQGVPNGHYFNNHGGDKDMERALEHQAQLIGRYEAEEKAQREWEEKFRENNSTTPDSCDPGNHSDVTEERDDFKAPAPHHPAGIIASQNQEAKLGTGDDSCDHGNHSGVTEERDEFKAPAPLHSAGIIASQNQEAKLGTGDDYSSKESKTPSGFQPSLPFDMGSLQDQKCDGMIAYKSPASESKVKHDQEYSDGHHFHGSHHYPDVHGTSGTHSAHVSSSAGGSLYKGEASENTNELALIPRENSNQLGSVLEALQQAKLSLKQKINRLPLLEGGSIQRAIEPSVPAARTRDRLAIPVGSAGLFSLPTDFQFEATTRANLLGSASQQSMDIYSPEPTVDKFFSSPYMESRSGMSSDDRFLTVPTFPYPDIRSRVFTPQPVFESSSDSGIPSSGNRYTYLDPHLSAGLPFSGNRYTHLDPHLGPGLPSSSNRSTHLDPYFSASLPSSGNRYNHLDRNLSAGLPSSGNGYTRIDPHFSASLPSSSNYNHPSYPNLLPGIPSDGGLPRFLPNREVGLPPATGFSFYEDQSRPNMYR